jgi:hypothetical protein
MRCINQLRVMPLQTYLYAACIPPVILVAKVLYHNVSRALFGLVDTSTRERATCGCSTVDISTSGRLLVSHSVESSNSFQPQTSPRQAQ